jgi:hypothetical protein
MDRALKILSATFAAASFLTLGCMVVFVSLFIIPNFPELQADRHQTAIIGVGLGCFTMLVIIYAQAARLIWRRAEWKKVMFLGAASCFGFPVGSILGVAALILLTRPGVRRTFSS